MFVIYATLQAWGVTLKLVFAITDVVIRYQVLIVLLETFLMPHLLYHFLMVIAFRLVHVPWIMWFLLSIICLSLSITMYICIHVSIFLSIYSSIQVFVHRCTDVYALVHIRGQRKTSGVCKRVCKEATKLGFSMGEKKDVLGTIQNFTAISREPEKRAENCGKSCRFK